MTDLPADWISEDGGLYALGVYIGWNPGDDEVVLDGKFSANTLRAIANYMDMKSTPKGCPRDTDGDGNCGQPACPICGKYTR